MTRTSTFVALLTGASLCLGACGSEAPSVVAQTGMLSAPFAGSSAKAVGYRLRNAVFAIEGPSPTSISSEDYLEQAEATVSLAAGAYTIALGPGWTLERNEESAFVPVAATLASPAVQSFSIVENQRSTVTYRFQAGTEMIDVGKPGLGVAIEVEDPPMKPVDPAADAAPPAVAAPPGQKPMPNQIALIGGTVCGIKADRTVFCSDGVEPFGKVQFEKLAGESYQGTLCGIGHPGHELRCASSFGQFYPPPSGAFTSLAVAAGAACATSTSGVLSCWGPKARPFDASKGPYTSVGINSWFDVCAVTGGLGPQCTVDFPRLDRNVTSVAVSEGYACGVGTDGTAICWGVNYNGQLLTPGGKFLQVTAGERHACGLRTDQSLACWGYDIGGTASPPSGNDFVDVQAARDATCALRADGTIVCWGPNAPKPAADLLAITVPPLVRAPQAGAWTALVPLMVDSDEYQDLLYYDAATGRAVYTAGTATPGQETVAYETTYATGWTDIIPAWHREESTLTDLTFYDAVSGNYLATIATGAPGVQTELYGGAGTPGCSSIVPMSMDADSLTDSLCYDAITGNIIFGASMGASARLMYGPGWTVIPVNHNADPDTDLLLYNRATGRVLLTVSDAPAVQLHLADLDFGAGFTAVVPIDINGDHLTDLLRYDASTGIAIYTVNLGDGVMKDIRTVQGPKGLKLFAPMQNTRTRKTTFIATSGAE